MLLDRLENLMTERLDRIATGELIMSDRVDSGQDNTEYIKLYAQLLTDFNCLDVLYRAVGNKQEPERILQALDRAFKLLNA